MKNYKIMQLTLLLFFTGSLYAQPVVLNPLVSTEIPSSGGNNNTGSDIARVLVGGIPTDINVMVSETGGGPSNLQYQIGAVIIPPVVLGNAGFPPGTILTDPDVVAVVSNVSGLGNLKEHLLVTYIVTPPGGNPNVYIEMFDWNGSTNVFANFAGPFNLTINPNPGGFGYCSTPNIDADFTGNYSVVWEESGSIYMASDNALSSWGVAPSKFVDHSNACGLLRDESEPDVCLIPVGTGPTSLISVAFLHNGYTLYLERIWTTQLAVGLIPFPAINCTTLPMLDTFSLHGAAYPPHDVRIACPPIVTSTRGVYDMTIAFTDYPFSIGTSDILTITHHQNSWGIGWYGGLQVNSVSGSFFPVGSNFVNKKPALAYKLNADEFVIAWEYSDSYASTSNSYYRVSPFRNARTDQHIIAHRMGDNNFPLNFDLSELDFVTNVTNPTSAVSISRGNNSPMRYTYTDGIIKGYNSTFTGVSLKKERDPEYLFLVGPKSTTGIDYSQYSSALKVFPNPVYKNNGKITVVLPDNLPVDVEVYSIAGALLHSTHTEDVKELTLDNNYESGTYLIHVTNEKQHYIRKLVVN